MILGSSFVILNPPNLRTANIYICYLKSICYGNSECSEKEMNHTFSTYFQTFSTPVFMLLSNKLPQKKKAKILHNPKSSDRTLMVAHVLNTIYHYPRPSIRPLVFKYEAYFVCGSAQHLVTVSS